ncbi:MAG: trypsin-like peptidase domain-containing protein [Myxococcales bacterium]|nr:trypsin-like peptidase domain-containing protein [Myxococcales bacterium]
MKNRFLPFALGATGLVTSIFLGFLAVGSGAAQGHPAARVSAKALGDAFSEVAEKVSPAVVSLAVEARVAAPQGHFFAPFGGAPGPGVQKGGGSGVIIRADGYILTNNHVVENAVRVEAHLFDGRRFAAEVVGTDPAADLAVLKIEAKGLKAAPFAKSDEARIGEWVVAIGSPFGLDYSVTTGVLSARGRGGPSEIGDYLQTDASINPGNSGGPLVNLDGQVLGINTFIIGRGSGIGFAIPSDLARGVAEQIIETGTVRRAWIGVSFQEVTPELASYFGVSEGQGALIGQVIPGSPAEQAGLRPGDVIVDVDGTTLTDHKDLQRQVLRKPVGAKLALRILRNKKSMDLQMKTAERPDEPGRPAPVPRGKAVEGQGALGLHLAPLDRRLRARLGYRGPGKIIVSGVESGSPADRAGLQRGDILISGDRHAIRTAADLEEVLADKKVVLHVHRGTVSHYLVLSAE